MPFYQYNFSISNQEERDVAIANLIVLGFDGFEETDTELIGFTTRDLNPKELKGIVEVNDVSYLKSIVEEINWNARWESEFQPIAIPFDNDDKVFVYVRAHFHPPLKDVLHDLIITPKMSFGTGHHATTHGMMSYMSTLNLQNYSVVDFGTGTGVLAILASKMGANKVLAIDNDPGCILNAKENIVANGCTNVQVQLSDHFETSVKPDLVLANINLNIIKNNLYLISEACLPDTLILFSGILNTDEAEILDALHVHDIKEINIISKDGWLIIAAKSGREIATLTTVS